VPLQSDKPVAQPQVFGAAPSVLGCVMVDVFTAVTADWQVAPPAATVKRTVAVFAPVVDVLNVCELLLEVPADAVHV
jgi:hypothetical protein